MTAPHPDPDALLDLALGDSAEAESLRAHLADCSPCAVAFAQLEAEQGALQAALKKEPAVPAGLQARVLSALPRQLRRAPKVLVFVAAALAIAAGVGVFTREDPHKELMLERLSASEAMALGLEDGGE